MFQIVALDIYYIDVFFRQVELLAFFLPKLFHNLHILPVSAFVQQAGLYGQNKYARKYSEHRPCNVQQYNAPGIHIEKIIDENRHDKRGYGQEQNVSVFDLRRYVFIGAACKNKIYANEARRIKT